MINKIHGNVQSMLVEARDIMQQHFSPQSRHHKSILPLCFPIKEKSRSRGKVSDRTSRLQQIHKEQEVKIQKYLETQPLGSFVRRKRTITESGRYQDEDISLRSKKRRQLTALRQDESDLLSTKIYGFQKQQKRQTNLNLPHLEQKVTSTMRNSLERNKDKGNRICFSSAKNDKKGLMMQVRQDWERILTKFSVNKRKKKLKIRLKNVKCDSEPLQLKEEEDAPSPWCLTEEVE